MKNLNAAVLLLNVLKTTICTLSLRSINIVSCNKKSFLFISFAVFPMLAQAQLEQYSKFNSDGSVEPIIDYFGSRKINDQFALTFFGLTREKWGQALIGLSYSPIEKITISASAGIEHGQKSPRYSFSIALNNKTLSFLALIEKGRGADNYLYKVNVFYEFSANSSLGIMDWRYHGLGPNFRYTITKLKATVWIMPAYDHEQGTGRCMAGISVSM
ncbi:hypothetical protein [Flavobacterium johnsoniae]|uniref:Uncharacterized protein n=1 Tax=Flavobacterium johnsoniae TaxID=986 RepID=A0A1J7BMZ0_FLAJO|nr:hypothetical protein [Flavobacterium johnsoniae]OIV40063.1 hypothetical protein BKM63_19085 [Flavobacterium johnsoniae]